MVEKEKEIILVDSKDRPLGTGKKIRVHREGRLHRSFSILIFNSQGELLLQKRAKEKYHSPGLWSNACCSHPRPGLNLILEARKRLQEEMGIDCELKEVFSFQYKKRLGDMIENEFDHVLKGIFDGRPEPNPDEVEDWRWAKLSSLKKEVKEHPENFTYWFKLILKNINKIN
ncbi:MAG: isopentenyl-diphosphate Delta-isomerase [Candidatus Nealsonbacteria bacterium]|nr:isopentenyl-diphosphate Delta-isomerase [Candidatus Nealsonbacteria bacterium]